MRLFAFSREMAEIPSRFFVLVGLLLVGLLGLTDAQQPYYQNPNPAVGPCHQLVATAANGQSRIVNLDALTSLPSPFSVSTADGNTYQFRVCSNFYCAGYQAAACQVNQQRALGQYQPNPAATLDLSVPGGAIVFTTQVIYQYPSIITVYCDPGARYVSYRQSCKAKSPQRLVSCHSCGLQHNIPNTNMLYAFTALHIT